MIGTFQRFVAGGAVLVLLLALAVRAQEPAPQPVHRDSAKLLEAVGDAARAHAIEDLAAMGTALDRIDANTRPLGDADRAVYGARTVNYDQAFHVTLDRARQLLAGGDLENAFNQFVWVQRACVVCHADARESGVQIPRPAPEAP